MKRVETAISRLMPDIDGKRVLEPACGCAEFSVAAAAHAAETVCFDLDDKRLDPTVRQTLRLRFDVMDATSMQYPENCFDTVVLYNAIGHLAHIAEPVLRECLRVVNRSGAVWIVSSFRMDKTVIQQTVLPLLDQMNLEYTLQDNDAFAYLRISASGMKSFETRAATVEDAETISALCINELGYQTSTEQVKEKLTSLLKSDQDRIFVAVADGRVVGFIHTASYDTLYFPPLKNLLGLAVAAAYRHRGIGSALLDAVEAWAKETGASGVRLNSGSTRLVAHQFYRKHGYGSEKQQLRLIKYFEQ